MLVLSHVVFLYFFFAGVSIIATRTGLRNYMFAVVCIHVVYMRGLDSFLVGEEVFDAIFTMVYAVFVMGEVEMQFFPVWEEMKFLKGF